MSSNKPHPNGQLPPLKVKNREKTAEDDVLLNDDLLRHHCITPITCSSVTSITCSSVTSLEIQSFQPVQPTNHVTIVEHDADDNSSPILHLTEIPTLNSSSPCQEDFFVDVSPRSEADAVLGRCLDFLQQQKFESRTSTPKDVNIFEFSVSKEEAELKECARKQACLILLRDCCVRLNKGAKFVRFLKDLTGTVVKNIEKLSNEPQKAVECDLFKDDVIFQLGEEMQTQSKHWFFIEKRLKSSELLRQCEDVFIKSEFSIVKRNLESLLHSSLLRMQNFITILIKYFVLLDTSQNIPQFAWQNFVKLTEKYNEVLTDFKNSTEKNKLIKEVTPNLNFFSINRILHLIAKECSNFGLNLFLELLIEPRNEFQTTKKVNWLPKTSIALYQNETHSPSSKIHSEIRLKKEEPCANEEQREICDLGQEEDLISHLLSCVTDCSNLISSSNHLSLAENNPSREKSVHWLEKSCASEPALMNLYVDLLRKEILTALELKWIQSCEIDDNQMGSVVFWSDSMILLVASRADQFAKKVGAAHAVRLAQNISTSLKLKASLAAWDERFCSALAACSNHRLPPVKKGDKIIGTQAGFAIADALEPLIAILPELRHDGKEDPWTLVEISILPCLRATLHLAFRWLGTSTDQLLGSWQIGNYLLITQSDLKRLVDLLKHLSTASLSTLNSTGFSTSLSWRFYVFQVSDWWDEINQINTEIQNISGSSIQKFYQKCCLVCEEAFAKNMPLGKIWRRKYRPYGPPIEHNQYIDDVIRVVLEDVLDGVKYLPMPVQISIVSMAMKSFCESWMAYICKHKIKFSLYGALLLRLDVVRLSSWLQSVPQLSIEAQQSIQALDVLRRLHGSSLLLTRQPRTHQRFRKTKISPVMSIADLNCDGDKIENVSSGDDLSRRGSITDEDFVPNKEEWLALRVRASPTRWQSLWCLR